MFPDERRGSEIAATRFVRAKGSGSSCRGLGGVAPPGFRAAVFALVNGRIQPCPSDCGVTTRSCGSSPTSSGGVLRIRGLAQWSDRATSGWDDREHAGNRGASKHLLSGLLKCAECGGSVFVLDRGGRYGCSWHRDRGPAVCPNRVTVPRAELERALEIVRASAAPSDQEGAKQPLAELGAQIARLVRLAEAAGDVDDIGGRIAALRRERDDLATCLRAPTAELDGPRLRELIHAELDRMHWWLSAPGSGGREVLRALLGGERMGFGPDAELTVRVEGAFEVRLDVDGQRGAAHFDQVVAGTGFEPVTFGL